MDSHFRTITKTISWRIWATVITFSVAYMVTRKVSIAVSVGMSDTVIKLLAYYLHERVWNKVDYGRREKVEVSNARGTYE